MHSHLDIEIQATPGGEYEPLVLTDDFSLSVEEQNPVFNDVSFFSYPASVSTRQNMAVLKNIGHRDSALRGMDFEHARARIIAEGLPLNTGQVITQEGAELSEEFQFNIDAQHESFSELIGDLECRDVRVKDHIVIGEQLGRIEYKVNYHAESREVQTYYLDGHVMKDETKRKNATISGVAEVSQALGFSYPGRTQGFPLADKSKATSTDVDNGETRPNENGSFGGGTVFGRGRDSSSGSGSGSSGSSSGGSSSGSGFFSPVVTESFINVSKPYPFPYCNARVAYAHRGKKRNSEGVYETDGYVKGNKKGEEIEDYGQYWCLDAFRQQSGICFYVLYFLDCLFEQLGVEFDNSELLEIEDMRRLCFFTTVCRYDLVEPEDGGKKLNSLAEINDWLRSRYCGGGGQIGFGFATTGASWNADKDKFSIDELAYEKDWGFGVDGNWSYHTNVYRKLSGTIEAHSQILDMYANSENFPKASVSSVISSLEASFGIRFIYDAEKRLVTARLLRNLYRRGQPRQFLGKVLSMTPVNEKITGVRMEYSAESDSKEQRDNVRYGIRDYDTDYDYIDFPPLATDASFNHHTVIDKTYGEIIGNSGLISPINYNVYVDQQTGNVYRIKIDSEAEKTMSLHPVLFQVGQFKGVEIGDCSEQNKDYVREYISEFQPLSLSVINALDYSNDHDGQVSPVLAPCLDVEMEHEYLEQRVQSIMYQDSEMGSEEWGGSHAFPGGLQFLCVQMMSLAESYDPTQTETGNSPLQEIDWGLTIGVMRGAGSDAELIEYDRGYDFFDNSKWKDTIAIYELTSDTMDPKGAIFDYNGGEEGDGGGERFSLQIRAWRKPDWADAPLVIADKSVRDRGLFDTFMREHAKFLLERKKYDVESLTTIAQLLDIRNHFSDLYIIDGKLGFINKISYEISRADGIGKVKIEFYSV